MLFVRFVSEKVMRATHDSSGGVWHLRLGGAPNGPSSAKWCAWRTDYGGETGPADVSCARRMTTGACEPPPCVEQEFAARSEERRGGEEDGGGGWDGRGRSTRGG